MFSKYRLISFSIFWFFLTLLPESSILPQTDVIFEHRLYLPLAGYCLFLVSGAYYLFGKNNFKTMVTALSLMIAFYSVLTYQRNKIWINEIVLWGDIVRKSPHKARPYINRGWAYYNQGNFIQAMSDYDKAIEISPELIYPYDDRGLIYARQGNTLKAIAEYDKAIKINPHYAEVYYHRGLAFLKQNNASQALSDYNKAIEINSEYVDAYNDRGQFYANQGNWTKAISDFTKSLKIDPKQENIRAKLFDLMKNLHDNNGHHS
jgi:tetratricopeptide (TPR) repeat protein